MISKYLLYLIRSSLNYYLYIYRPLLIGDHSTTTREELSATEALYNRKPAFINLPESVALTFIQTNNTNSNNSNNSNNNNNNQSTTAPPTTDITEQTIKKLEEAKVIAIIRSNSADLAIERALELVDLGCRALEVTMDTQDVIRVLKEIGSKVRNRYMNM